MDMWFTAIGKTVTRSTNASGYYVNPTFEINYYDTTKLYNK